MRTSSATALYTQLTEQNIPELLKTQVEMQTLASASALRSAVGSYVRQQMPLHQCTYKQMTPDTMDFDASGRSKQTHDRGQVPGCESNAPRRIARVMGRISNNPMSKVACQGTSSDAPIVAGMVTSEHHVWRNAEEQRRAWVQLHQPHMKSGVGGVSVRSVQK